MNRTSGRARARPRPKPVDAPDGDLSPISGAKGVRTKRHAKLEPAAPWSMAAEPTMLRRVVILMEMPTDRKVHSNDVDGGPNEDGYSLEVSTSSESSRGLSFSSCPVKWRVLAVAVEPEDLQ